MTGNPLLNHIEFHRAFLAAKTSHERGDLCRAYLTHLLPANPAAREKTHWTAVNLGTGSVARIGVIETVGSRPEARLMLLRGRRMVHSSRHANAAGALHDAYLFDWNGVNE